MPASSSQATPYLSLVAASRNDDHGGDPLRRTQIFVNCFARQCEKHRLPAELILVDWNPVPDRPGLAAVLNAPAGTTYCQLRVITVPAVLHHRLKYADRISFFQMIAKNAGIRRARGRFILATNIDIIFSDELMQFIARQQLDPKKMYRVDRHDIQAGLAENLSVDETLAYAWTNPIRQHRRIGPQSLLKQLYGDQSHQRVVTPDPEFSRRFADTRALRHGDAWQLEIERAAPMANLHTNACGDFKLISREGWEAIRGYPEFEAFSFNIDSMGLVAAHYAGYTEVTLLPPCVAFHIEHSLGSGWTPEGAAKLFARLRRAGVLNPEWPVLLPLVDQMRREQRTLEFNHAGWGLAAFELPEEVLGNPAPADPTVLRHLASQAATLSVAAIEPAFDLDRLALALEFRTQAESGFMTDSERTEGIVQLFVPDAVGAYAEETSLIARAPLRQLESVIFRVEQYPSQFPLRLDPVAATGVIEIAALTLLDVGSKRILLRFDGANASELGIGGTAQFFQVDRPLTKSTSGTPIYILSTGDDPQLVLPPLAEPPSFPLLLIVELRLLPS